MPKASWYMLIDAVEMMGAKRPEDLLNKNVLDFVHPGLPM